MDGKKGSPLTLSLSNAWGKGSLELNVKREGCNRRKKLEPWDRSCRGEGIYLAEEGWPISPPKKARGGERKEFSLRHTLERYLSHSTFCKTSLRYW